MAKKKGKAVSFDAMVKFFIQYYDLPTKMDIEKLINRIDRLELLMRDMASSDAAGGRAAAVRARGGRALKLRSKVTAADTVCDALQTFKAGADLAAIQARTGFSKKKLRNLIFRLHKLGRIQRQGRGVYCVKNG